MRISSKDNFLNFNELTLSGYQICLCPDMMSFWFTFCYGVQYLKIYVFILLLKWQTVNSCIKHEASLFSVNCLAEGPVELKFTFFGLKYSNI